MTKYKNTVWHPVAIIAQYKWQLFKCQPFRFASENEVHLEVDVDLDNSLKEGVVGDSPTDATRGPLYIHDAVHDGALDAVLDISRGNDMSRWSHGCHHLCVHEATHGEAVHQQGALLVARCWHVAQNLQGCQHSLSTFNIPTSCWHDNFHPSRLFICRVGLIKTL